MVRNAVGNPRRSLAAAAVVLVSVVGTTTFTSAAWVDDEWAAGAVGVGSPGDCTTNTLFSSGASALQLSGSVLGADLGSIAGIEGLSVTNTGAAALPEPVTATSVAGVPDAFLSKLSVTALDSSPVTAGLGLGAPVGSLGAYTQWAQARNSGQARAASGLVSDQSGAVDVTGTATGAHSAPQSARISLGEILPDSLAGVILDVGALASSSSVEGCTMVNGWPTLAAAPDDVRTYGVAGLDLGVDVRAAGAVVSPTNAVLDGLPTTLNNLQEDLAEALNTGVQDALGSLGLVSSTTEAALGGVDLAPVRMLLQQPQNQGAVTLKLATGRLGVNLAELPGGAPLINGRAPNSPVVLTAADVTQLQHDVRTLLGQIPIRVQAAVDAVTVSATVEAEVAAPILGTDLGSARISIAGTLGEFRTGSPKPTITTVGLDLASLSGALTAAVLGAVATAVVEPTSAVVSELKANLVPPIAAAVGDAGTLLTAVAALVSIHVNVQPDQPWPGTRPQDVAAAAGQYKVSAIRVGLSNQPGLLSLSLSTSTAGPVNYRIP